MSPQQVACIIMSLDGRVKVYWRSAKQGLVSSLSETSIWAEVWKRRLPECALFVDDECVWPGDFKTKEAAVTVYKQSRRRV